MNEFTLIASYTKINQNQKKYIVTEYIFKRLVNRWKNATVEPVYKHKDDGQNMFCVLPPTAKPRTDIRLLVGTNLTTIDAKTLEIKKVEPDQELLGITEHNKFMLKFWRDKSIQILHDGQAVCRTEPMMNTQLGSSWTNFCEMYKVARDTLYFIDFNFTLRKLPLKPLLSSATAVCVTSNDTEKIRANVSEFCLADNGKHLFMITKAGDIFKTGEADPLASSRSVTESGNHYRGIGTSGKLIVLAIFNKDQSNVYELFSIKGQFLHSLTDDRPQRNGIEVKTFKVFAHRGVTLAFSSSFWIFASLMAVNKKKELVMINNKIFLDGSSETSSRTCHCVDLVQTRKGFEIWLSGYPSFLNKLVL